MHIKCVCMCVWLCTCTHTVDSSANLWPMTARPAALSRKARRGSAEMSGCYRNSPTYTSTEKYRMVKERRGRGVVSPGMDRR